MSRILNALAVVLCLAVFGAPSANALETRSVATQDGGKKKQGKKKQEGKHGKKGKKGNKKSKKAKKPKKANKKKNS